MSVEDQRAEVQRIVRSPQFRRAPKLRCFLELICDYHFQDRTVEINEYVIAHRAFGKGEGFDPSQDSLVRVQARELRRRLHEYYQGEGKTSRWIIQIPVGHYAPVFTEAAAVTEAAAPVAAPLRKSSVMRAAWFVLAGTVLTCAVLLFAADHERRLLIQSTAIAARPTLNPTVAGLWNRFLESDVPTLLVVSNPDVAECGDHRPGTAGCEEYTGMGEAVGIHLITSLFRTTKVPLIVKPSRIVTADDIKRHNLILLGGKSVNVWTKKLGDGLSLAEPNPPPQYKTVLDNQTGEITRDRGIVALRRNPETGRWVLFLWGNHSQGTGAAVEASTDERFLAELHWPGKPFPESFHVLVSVAVNDGIAEQPVPAVLRVP